MTSLIIHDTGDRFSISFSISVLSLLFHVAIPEDHSMN